MTHATTDFQIRLNEADGATVVCLSGDAGFRHADRIADALATVADKAPRKVDIDLSGLEFVSSLVIGVLVTFKYRLRRQGAAMALVRAPRRIEEALRVARVFDDVIVNRETGHGVN